MVKNEVKDMGRQQNKAFLRNHDKNSLDSI